MTINAVELTSQIIRPTLEYLGMSSHLAEQTLLSMAAENSKFELLYQRGKGIGIYQISSAQHRSVWDDFLAFKSDLASKVRGLASQRQFLQNPDRELLTNLSYSTAIAWVSHMQAESLQQTSCLEKDEMNLTRSML